MKIVDLEINEEGVYTFSKAFENRPKNIKKKIVNKSLKSNPIKNNLDYFVDGMDLGLDFLESFQYQLNRIMKLRG